VDCSDEHWRNGTKKNRKSSKYQCCIVSLRPIHIILYILCEIEKEKIRENKNKNKE
jgi:hypothetical protein